MNAPELLDLGDELPPLYVTLSAAQVRQYAEMGGVAGGRFSSDEEAQREGLPRQIAPGNLSLALLSRLVLGSLPSARLLRLSATFRALVHPGEALVVTAVVTDRRSLAAGDQLDLDLLLSKESGDRCVTGTATIQLPPAADGSRATD